MTIKGIIWTLINLSNSLKIDYTYIQQKHIKMVQQSFVIILKKNIITLMNYYMKHHMSIMKSMALINGIIKMAN